MAVTPEYMPVPPGIDVQPLLLGTGATGTESVLRTGTPRGLFGNSPTSDTPGSPEPPAMVECVQTYNLPCLLHCVLLWPSWR